MKDRNLCVVIAARNEAENIDMVVKGASLWGDVVVVDNASTDRTKQIAWWAGASVIANKQDIHIRRSYIRGFEYALSQGYDQIVQLDAGLSFLAQDIDWLLTCEKSDLVIGGRPDFTRKLVSRLGGIATRTITGMPFRDATSGFRLWKADALRRLNFDTLTCYAHGFQIELLWQAWKAGMDIKTIPVHYTPGRTSANRAVALEALRAIWRMRK